jgi:hypothetical protein
MPRSWLDSLPRFPRSQGRGFRIQKNTGILKRCCALFCGRFCGLFCRLRWAQSVPLSLSTTYAYFHAPTCCSFPVVVMPWHPTPALPALRPPLMPVLPPAGAWPPVHLKAHTPAKLHFRQRQSPQMVFPPIESGFPPLAV